MCVCVCVCILLYKYFGTMIDRAEIMVYFHCLSQLMMLTVSLQFHEHNYTKQAGVSFVTKRDFNFVYARFMATSS